MDITDEQAAVCARYGATPVSVNQDLTFGIGALADPDIPPLNGLRHTAENGTSGWYVWSGERIPDVEWRVMHHDHVKDWRPDIEKYLALPPGWRFLIAPGHEDVWFDSTLIFAPGE